MQITLVQDVKISCDMFGLRLINGSSSQLMALMSEFTGNFWI